MMAEAMMSDGYALRADAWRALSALFVFPAGEDGSVHRSCLDMERALDALGHPAVPLAQELCLQALTADGQALRVEFTRLFIGPFQTAAPPYGSFYLEDGTLMGQTTVQVMNAYIASGVMLHRQFHDLPDHVAAECEFLYYLLSNLAQLTAAEHRVVAAEIRAVHDAFLCMHLSAWIPAFHQRLAEHADLKYFRTLATLTERFVMYEASNLHSPEAMS